MAQQTAPLRVLTDTPPVLTDIPPASLILAEWAANATRLPQQEGAVAAVRHPGGGGHCSRRADPKAPQPSARPPQLCDKFATAIWRGRAPPTGKGAKSAPTLTDKRGACWIWVLTARNS